MYLLFVGSEQFPIMEYRNVTPHVVSGLLLLVLLPVLPSKGATPLNSEKNVFLVEINNISEDTENSLYGVSSY